MKTKLKFLSIIFLLAGSASVYATATTAVPFPPPGTWYRPGGVSLGSGLYFLHITTGLTATAGGAQGTTQTPTVTEVNEFTTVTSSGDSLTLTCDAAGKTRFIENAAATNAMKIFSVTPGTINGISTGTGYSLAAGKAALCVATAKTTTANVCNWACVGP